MKAGDIIEVSQDEIYRFPFEREFIGMTSNYEFLCWDSKKTYAYVWNYGRKIDQFKELKECEALGAKFEYVAYFNNLKWEELDGAPKWNENAKYRIKGGITPEQFKKHNKEIIAWWNGAEIEFYNGINEAWVIPNLYPTWEINTKYRVKDDKTVYEWMYYKAGAWHTHNKLMTKEQAKAHFISTYKETGRSWEITK